MRYTIYKVLLDINYYTVLGILSEKVVHVDEP